MGLMKNIKEKPRDRRVKRKINPTILIICEGKNTEPEYFNLFKDMHWAWTFSIYVAFALIIWIQVETIFVQSVGWLQTFYMLYTIPVILVALLPKVRAIYKN